MGSCTQLFRKFKMENIVSEQDKKDKVADDMVVSLDYELTVDGQVVDSSKGSAPIQFIQGQGHIVPGLEKGLYGMTVGENKQITVAPTEGYGDLDPQAVVEVPRDEFPPDIPLEPSVKLQVRDRDGGLLYATIAEVGEENVKLDFNHELAGKELNFDVTIVDVRPATEDEIGHGHVHGPEGQH